MQSPLLLERFQARRKVHQVEPPGTDGSGPLLQYIPLLSRKLKAPEHLSAVANLFERASNGEEVRACVSVPPQHGKTLLILHGITWMLKRHPDWTIAYTSYNGKQAMSKSRLARDLADEAHLHRRIDADSLSEWRLREGGGVLARGVGEGLTGQEVHVGIVDDPHKDRTDAESVASRKHVMDWLTGTFLTRLHQGGAAIVVHTRWHPDDMIGQLKKQAERGEVPWEIINLPAIDEAGAALAEWLRPLDFLIRKKAEVGEYDWASMYDGKPRPRSGQVFHDAYYYEPPAPQGMRVSIGVDLAYSEKTSSDWSIAVVLGQRADENPKNATKYVLEVRRAQVQADAFAAELAGVRRRYPGAPMRFYGYGAEIGAGNLINALDQRIRLEVVSKAGDKFLRAQPASVNWNGGRILVPREAPWTNPFLGVVCGFTGIGDAHDDDVDALAAANDVLDETSAPFEFASSGHSVWGTGAPT